MGSILRNASKIAAGQQGCITAKQLIGLGLGRSGISKWRRKGLLHREFQGTFRFGHAAPSIEARYTAAVLACGPGAALSGLAGSHHRGLIKRPPSLIEVTNPKDRDIEGIKTRRRTIPYRTWKGIPTATVEQLILDLAEILPLDDLAHACHMADVIYGVKHVDYKGKRGAAKLKAIYDGDHALLLSQMEREFRRLLETHHLPLPQFNRKKGKHYIDAHYSDPPITIELQSFKHHSTRAAWEADFERRREARRRGDAFLPYTWRDVFEQPKEMLEELGRALSS